MVRFLVSFALLFSSLVAQASQLVALNDKEEERVTVLVGGIGSSYDYFESWVAPLSRRDEQVLGFAHDHRSMRMSEGAAELARELKALTHVKVLTIHAHSMGGLIAKRALHLLEEDGTLAQFEKVSIHTYGTPFGGFFMANFARWIPLPHSLALKLGIPMAKEMGSTSELIKALGKPLPGHVQHTLHQGDLDTIGTPSSESGKLQYQLVVQNANHVVTHPQMNHDQFASTLVASL